MAEKTKVSPNGEKAAQDEKLDLPMVKLILQRLVQMMEASTPETKAKDKTEAKEETKEETKEKELEKSASVIDYLISVIHREFTMAADFMYGDGLYNQDERISLSAAIGAALDTFNDFIDAHLPQLRSMIRQDYYVTTKSEIVPFEATVEVAKSDEEERITYGVAYPVMPDNWVDTQNHHMNEVEVKRMAYRYMMDSQRYDLHHQITDVRKDQAIIVESYLAPIDLDWPLPDGSTKHITKGSWIVATHYPDPEIWSKVKNGEFQAYSIRGHGKLTRKS